MISGKWTGAVSPYRWRLVEAGGWRITYGLSGFLIAQGSGWSRPEGMALYRDLEDKYWKRKCKTKKP